MLFPVLSYGISTTFLQTPNSLRFPIHLFKGVHFALVFKKNNCSENFCILWILSSETSRVKSFLSTLVGFLGIAPKSSLEQLFCRQGFIEQFRCPLFGTKNSIFQLSFETQSYCIYFCPLFVCFVTEILEFICSNVLAAKCKRYLRFSYMQLFDYLQIHDINT